MTFNKHRRAEHKSSSANGDDNNLQNNITSSMDISHLSHNSQYSHKFEALHPFLKHYSLTLSTVILSATAFALALFSGLSCSFLKVPADAYDDITQFDPYLSYNRSREKNEVLTLGLFCEGDLGYMIDTSSKDSITRTISKAFLISALFIGAINICVTLSISTFLPTTSKIWNGITVLSLSSFLLQLPTFILFSSPPCNEYKCVLGTGSFALLCSLSLNLVLVLVTHFVDMPEWKEEWELWRLVKRNKQQQHQMKLSLENVDVDEEMGGVTMKFEPNSISNNEKCVDAKVQPIITEQEINKKVKKIEAWNDLHYKVEDGSTTSSDSRREIVKHANKNVGKLSHRNMKTSHKPLDSLKYVVMIPTSKEGYADLDGEDSPTTPSRKEIAEISPVSPMTQGSEGNVADQQTPVSPISDCTGIRSIPSLERNDHDDNNDHVEDVDGDVEDDEKSSITGNDHEKKILLPCAAVDSSAMPPTKAFPSTVSTTKKGGEKSSLSNIFKRKSSTKENSMKNSRLIQEQWMLEETSIGDSNSEGLAFFEDMQRARRHEKVLPFEDLSQKSSDKKVIEFSDNHLVCSPPPTIIREMRTAAAVISPSEEDIRQSNNVATDTKVIPMISSPIKAQGAHVQSAIVSPENDYTKRESDQKADRDSDPEVEIYPSESSLSEMSLPTRSEPYTCTDSEDDGMQRHNCLILSVPSEDSNDSSASSELSAVIAGVRALNRKTSGKITPMNRRRRRRKKKSSSSNSGMSSGNSYSSCGSLLDEVILEEEVEADLSNDADADDGVSPKKNRGASIVRSNKVSVPALITASPYTSKKRNHKPNGNQVHFSDDEHSGYENGYLSRVSVSGHTSSDGSARSSPNKAPKKSRYCQLLDHGEVASFAGVSCSSSHSSHGYISSKSFASDAEESFSSQAARARRNRILSNKKIHNHSDNFSLDSMPVPEAINYAPTSHSLAKSSHHSSSQTVHIMSQQYIDTSSEGNRLLNNHGMLSSDDDGVSNLSVRSNLSWQARKYRISRLRMQREHTGTVHDVGSIVTRVQNDDLACDSDECSI